MTTAFNCFFIVGAPRCGTSSMASYLRRHPEVCFSSPKETNFFIAADPRLSPEALRAQYVKAFFQPSPATRILGEGSVSTLYSVEAQKRAQACFPDAKFIVMLRNPIEMIRSYHARLLFVRQETEQDLQTAWDLQDERLAGRRIPRGCYDPRMLQYREAGSLGRATAALFETVGRENCMAIVHEDFVADTAAVYRKALEFIGLPDDNRTEFPRKNQNAGYRRAWLQAIYSGTFLGPLGGIVARHPHRLARLARLTRPLRKWVQRGNRVITNSPPLGPEMAVRLTEAFREDIRLLEKLLGRDLGGWLDQYKA